MKNVNIIGFALALAIVLMVASSCGIDDAVKENEVETKLASGSIASAFTIPNRYDDAGKADYVLHNDLYISGAVTIEPGVTIEVGFGYTITIEGESAALTAKGTSSMPIIIRGTEPKPGHWMGLVFQDASSTRNVMEYVEIYHGGQANWDDDAPKSNVLVNFFITNSRINFTNCTFAKSGGDGFLVYNNGNHDVSFNNCDFVDNAGKALVAPHNVIHDFSATNSLQNNGVNAVEINGMSDGLPKLKLNKLSNPEAFYIISDGLEITEGLDIAPGITAKFSTDAYIDVSGERSYFHAIGTQNEPIVLTAMENIAGFWRGVRIYDCVSPKNQLSYVLVSYAGKADVSNGTKANLVLEFYLSTATADVNNCTFSYSDGYGIYIDYETIMNGDNNLVESANNFSNNSLENVFIVK